MNATKNIVVGGLIGGILGTLTGFLATPGETALTAAVGIFLGVGFGWVIKANQTNSYAGQWRKDGKIYLHEEKLDISKKKVVTAKVTMHTETLTEEKKITVPVTREELVIENKDLEKNQTETIRIPLSEEQVEVVKYPVILENVAISRREFQDTQCIEETLKKEKLHLETTGDVKILDKEKA